LNRSFSGSTGACVVGVPVKLIEQHSTFQFYCLIRPNTANRTASTGGGPVVGKTFSHKCAGQQKKDKKNNPREHRGPGIKICWCLVHLNLIHGKSPQLTGVELKP
jgi:hypothetical protein